MTVSCTDPRSRFAGRTVLRWVDAYTRGLDAAIARQRRAELASDVWEQINDADMAGRTGGPVLLWRAARSVPADLAWRRQVHRGGSSARPPIHLRWERSGLLAVLATEAVVIAGVMLATIVHVLHGGGAGSLGSDTAAVVSALVGGLLLGLAGLVLLARLRTRWIAPAVLGVAAVVLLLTAVPALVRVSTTVAAVYYASPLIWTHPGWSDLSLTTIAVVAVFHVAVLVAWVPARPHQAGRGIR